MSSTVAASAVIDREPELTRKMTGGQATVETLIRNGVNTIFGLPGVQLDGLFNALYDTKDQIRVVHTRHEQATAYMADGYSRVTGKEGICLVVPGPGVMNAAAGLATAYACNSSVLCLTGQIRSDMIGVGRGLLHEIPDQLGMARSFSKHAARAARPGEIPGALNESFSQMRTGRSRPVYLEVPPDIYFAEGEVSLLEPAAQRERSSGDPDQLRLAAKALSVAQNPLIYVGGGAQISNAGHEILELARMLQAPIIVTQHAKGVVSDRDDLVLGELAGPVLRPKADVVLAIGTRFLDYMDQPYEIDSEHTLIRIDIDDEEMTRSISPGIQIVADGQAAVAALIEIVSPGKSVIPSKNASFRNLKTSLQERANSVLPQAAFARAIRETLPDEAILVSEMTQLGYWSKVGYPVYLPNTFLGAGYQGTLGFGFTMAMGAKVGKPDVPVVSINGDGGFGFTLNELSTLVQHKIGVIAIVFNDRAYGNVKRVQQQDLGGRTIASDLVNPDYLKLADAFGIQGRRAETPDDLAQALADAARADEPALIEVPVQQMPNPWKILGLR